MNKTKLIFSFNIPKTELLINTIKIRFWLKTTCSTWNDLKIKKDLFILELNYFFVTLQPLESTSAVSSTIQPNQLRPPSIYRLSMDHIPVDEPSHLRSKGHPFLIACIFLFRILRGILWSGIIIFATRSHHCSRQPTFTALIISINVLFRVPVKFFFRFYMRSNTANFFTYMNM